MQCSGCGKELGMGTRSCPSCGTAVPRGSSEIDRIADEAAQVVHDVVRAVQSAQKVGEHVSQVAKTASRNAKRGDRGKATASGVWAATRALVAESDVEARKVVRGAKRQVRSAGRTGQRARSQLQAKSRAMARKPHRSGRAARG
jgi:hypothetical protein